MRKLRIFRSGLVKTLVALALLAGPFAQLVAQQLTVGPNFALGLVAYEHGNYSDALKHWQPLAEQGDPRAQIGLGVLYLNGEAVAENAGQAAQWFRLAAERGSADAEFMLAGVYLVGQGVPMDSDKAISLFWAAAKNGHAIAQYNLALSMGPGIVALLSDNREMQFAVLNRRNRKDQAHDKEAAKWMLEAANRGYTQAQYAFGRLCMAGVGVREDLPQAAKWFREAADKGYAEAQYALSLMFFAPGSGLPRDDVQAYMWLSLAGRGPHKFQIDVELLLPPLAAHMKPAEIAEANRLVNEWKPKPDFLSVAYWYVR